MARTPGLNTAGAIVTPTLKQADGVTPCLNPPTVAVACFATVRVRYTFKTITPWPQYLLNGAFQITLRGGSMLVIQR